MYQRSSGLTKFVILFSDCLCIAISLFLMDSIWHDYIKHISRGGASYSRLVMISMAVYLLVFLFTRSFGDFYIRGYLLEFWSVIKANVLMILGITLILFFLQMGKSYSRMVFILFPIANCIFMWIARLILKRMLPYVYTKMVAKRNVIIVGTTAFVKDIVKELGITKDYSVELVGMSLTDGASAEEIEGIKSISEIDELTDFCRSASVDEVVVEIDDDNRDKLLPIMDELAGAGIIIKYRSKLPRFSAVGCQAVGRAGDYLVATYATRSVSTGNVLVKRSFDIFAGAIGSIVTLILAIFIAPAIKIESKGPVFFAQKRVGKNGRIFTIYKFRSMYADAEERKAELLKHNEMDGLMFKIEDDPRITKVGKFLRKTSIDEFPQFFNVFTGDMSMVGTRPPTLDEFEKYNLDQKGRLSFRPGLTGLWQVSGRNDVTDFDEIVALDKEYIRNWSPIYDLKIMLKTVPVMFSGK